MDHFRSFKGGCLSCHTLYTDDLVCTDRVVNVGVALQGQIQGGKRG